MKIGILTNKYNIFLNLYLKKLNKIPKKDIFLIVENSKFPKRNKDIIKDRLTTEFKKGLINDNKKILRSEITNRSMRIPSFECSIGSISTTMTFASLANF